jgi:CHASE2 domain-containing sensor protein
MNDWDRPQQGELPSKLFWRTLGRQRDPRDENRMKPPSTAGAVATVLIAIGLIGGAAFMWIAWVPAVAVIVGLLGVVLLMAGILGWRESRWEGRITERG